MEKIEIKAVRGGWSILLNDKKMAFIEAESFYLKEVRFKENAEELIHFHQLLWTLYVNEPYPYIWGQDYSVKVCDNVWSVIATNQEKTMQAETVLEVLTEGDGLKYVINQKLNILSDFEQRLEYFDCDGKRNFRFEFTDPYWKGIVGPAYDFSGFWPGIFYPGVECDAKEWKKKWSMFVTENPKGKFTGRLHNHQNFNNNLKIPENCIFTVLEEKAGNPAYRFLSTDCLVGICWWGYDTHFNLIIEGNSDEESVLFSNGQEFSVKYELFCLGNEEIKEIKENLIMDTVTPITDRPIVEAGLNRFDKRLEITNPLSMPWIGWSKGCKWDTECGYDDNYSLRLDSDGTEIPVWQNRFGQENFMKPIEAGKKYRLSLYIKTDEVSGEGAVVGVSFGVPKYPGMHGELLPTKVYQSDKFTGNNEWTKIDIITDFAPEGAISADIVMMLKGNGTVWFDNLLFETIE